MNRKHREIAFGLCLWAGVAIPLLFNFPAVADSAKVATGIGTGLVAGRVLDSKGQPLSEAFVSLYSASRRVQITLISRRDGTFGNNLPAGDYSVVGQLRGYSESSVRDLMVKAGHRTEVKIALEADTNGTDLESQITGSELLSQLPEDARRTMAHRCDGCHSAGAVGGNRMDQQGWQSLVDKMAHMEPVRRPSTEANDLITPWQPTTLDDVTVVLTKYLGTGKGSYQVNSFPVHNTPELLSQVVVKEYQLKRSEINAHDVVVDASGKRIWYSDQASGLVAKHGLFGWINPWTGESKEYEFSQCAGLGGRIFADKVGRVWVGCGKGIAYWDPRTDELVTFPMAKYGMHDLWTVDSHDNVYSIIQGKEVDPSNPKSSYLGKFPIGTREWTLCKVPSDWGHPYEAVTDSKDNIWFTEIAADKVGKLDTDGKFTEYPVPTKGGAPRRMSMDPDDNVWFTEFVGSKIGMVDTHTGKVTEYDTPTPIAAPYACGVDKYGIVWFSEINAIRIVRFDPKAKTFREYPIPDRLSSIKNFAFTYSNRKETVWGSDETGPESHCVRDAFPLTKGTAFWIVAVLVSSLLYGCSSHSGPETAVAMTAEQSQGLPVYPSTAAEITGKVLFDGQAPKLPMIQMDRDPACAQKHDGGVEIPDGKVNDNGTLPNVFVYVKDGAGQYAFPVPANPVTLDQDGCMYQPHVLGLMVGQTLRIVSHDSAIHNIHFISQRNGESNQSEVPGSPPIVKKFDHAEIMIPVKCNVHPWMKGFVGVTSNPLFAVTETDGTFSIKGVPPGKYSLEAWTATYGVQDLEVTVSPKSVQNVNFQFR